MSNWFDKLFKQQAGGIDDSRCDHSAIQMREGTADFEWFIAKSEIENSGDLGHGARHLDRLLSFDPSNQEWLELLERYMTAVPDLEALIPRGDQLYYSTEAMRAYIWYRRGRFAEAIDLLSNVVSTRPDSRYLEAWGLPWLEPPNAIEQLEPANAAFLFSVLLTRFPEAKYSPAIQLQFVLRWANLVDRYLKTRPEMQTPEIMMVNAGMFRKAGLFDQAEAVARQSFDQTANWFNTTSLGLIMREKGDPRAAEQFFRKALEFDPSDVSARLEAADTFFELGDWQNALNWYEDALKKESNNEWAKPSANFCRWMINDQKDQIEAVVAQAQKGNARAQSLAYQAFHGGLPEPADATANIVRQLREQIILSGAQEAPSGQIQLTLSSLEAPSNFLAFRMEMEALNSKDVRLEVTCKDIPTPDPRKSIAEIPHPIWQFEGTEASPALPAPPADVVEAVARLAQTKYDRQANFAAASRVAAQLGPARVRDLLAVMVHPPAIPKAWTSLAWLPRVQLTAALIVAQLDSGWEGSARREGLLSVLFGPQDWATEAAIRAMAMIGADEVLAPKIDEAFQHLAKQRPSFGYCCWELTLYTSWIELPHLFDHERQQMEEVIRMIESSD